MHMKKSTKDEMEMSTGTFQVSRDEIAVKFVKLE